MVAGAIRGGVRPDVGRRGPDGQAPSGQSVVGVKVEGKRIALLGMEDERHEHPVPRLLAGGPVDPARQPVQRVVPSLLGERGLMELAAEFVLAVLDAVGPGKQQLAAADAAHLALRITVDDVAVANRVPAKTGPDFGDDRALLAEGQDKLLPGGWAGGHRNRIIEGWHG